jgi:2-dehydropantoate 2-reductase
LNPVSALTGAHSADILDDPLVSQFILSAMAEAASIGTAAGCMPAQSEQQRLTAMRQHGAVQSSMLQDMQAGRPLELDPLIGATHEIGRRFGVAMPALAALLGLTRLMARQRGLYRH